MTLFESPSQFREKATICRMFELLPLYAPLAEGHVFRWFALNMPMDLETGGRFTSDMDIVACLLPYPASAPLQPYPRPRGGLIYKTWEVKVSLLYKDGTARSLKSGKTRSTMKQLRAYRNFGSPDVSLLETCIYVNPISCVAKVSPLNQSIALLTRRFRNCARTNLATKYCHSSTPKMGTQILV